MGGRRRVQILFPPSLPPSSQHFANMVSLQCLLEEGKHLLHVPKVGCVFGQGLPQAHDLSCALLSVPLPHAVPSTTPPRATPQEFPPNQGYLSAPSFDLKCQ